MAYFAQINSGGVVVSVIAVSNQILASEGGVESEANGITHLERHGAEDGFYWKQTSYNTRAGQHSLGDTPLRKNYAGKGYTYDPDRDAFIAPKPYDSWLLDELTCTWEVPIPYPDDGENYLWNEETKSWLPIKDYPDWPTDPDYVEE